MGFDFLAETEPEILKQKIVDCGLFSMAELEDYKSLSQVIDFVYNLVIEAISNMVSSVIFSDLLLLVLPPNNFNLYSPLFS